MQGEAERALGCRPPSLPNRPHFDADSIESAIPRTQASLFVRALVAHEPRHHVYSVRLSFLPQLRDKRLRDAFRQQRLERGEFGAFPLTAHRGSLSQLISDGHVHPRRGAIGRDDSPITGGWIAKDARRLHQFGGEQRCNVLASHDGSGAAGAHDRRQAAWRLRLRRRTPWRADFFCVGSDIWWPSIDAEGRRPI